MLLELLLSSNAMLRVSQQVAWGQNTYGQSMLQPGLTNIVAISAGGYHDLHLTGNGIASVGNEQLRTSARPDRIEQRDGDCGWGVSQYSSHQ